jgi:hypothetical protein
MKPPKHVSLSCLDFENIARLTDVGVISHFKFVCRASKKPIVPRTARFNKCQITREPRAVTLHFLSVNEKTSSEKETFRFSFIPVGKFA